MSISDIEDKVRYLSHRQRHFFCEKLTEITYSKYVREGDSAIDCGANIGQHTRLLSRIVGPGGRVHAFEPNPDLFKGLLALGANVRLWPFAAGDDLQICCLHIPEGLIGWASLEDIRALMPERKFKLITTTQIRIDDIPELHQETIRFVKIDVERNELRVLLGMKSILKKNNPIIIFEGINARIREFFFDINFEVWDLFGREWNAGRPIIANVLAAPVGSVGTSAVLPSEDELRMALAMTLEVVKG